MPKTKAVKTVRMARLTPEEKERYEALVKKWGDSI